MITPLQAALMQKRCQPHEPPAESKGPYPKSESDLHDQITDYCLSRGWYFVHSRMDRRTTNAVGTPDFVIAGPDGVTFWIEAKRKGKKPTTEQLAAGVQLRHFGHRHEIVYTFGEFLTAIETPTQGQT
jgi:hypothetical protein